MAQHDYDIANQTAPNFRTDLNSALLAIVTLNSGNTAPTAPFKNMLWYEEDTNTLWKRNEANSAWINLGTVDEANGKFEPNQTFATQAEAEALTNTTKPMSPLRTSQSIVAKLNAGGSAPMYACRAWIKGNWDGTILASGNIASVTKNGTGDYTVTFTTAMQDANYAITGIGQQTTTVPNGFASTIDILSQTASSFRFYLRRPTDRNIFDGIYNIAIFR